VAGRSGVSWERADKPQVIHVEAKNEVRKRIVRELRIMHDCNSEYIVDFYGAFQNESGDVIMCMEYMDVGYVPCSLQP
jgi:mitogen-activated protein kinase kinase